MASRALEIDPLSPYTNASLGLALLAAGRLEDSLRALNEALDIDSDYLLALWILTATYGALGRYDDAVSVAERAAVLSERSSFYLGWLGWAYGLAGQRDRAERIVDELTSKSQGEYIRPIGMVQVNIGLGNIDEAVEWLETACTVGDPLTAHLSLPYMDPLRADPRFDAVRERLGIPG
jgi:tetratricopeptide (TPR) repeat protein